MTGRKQRNYPNFVASVYTTEPDGSTPKLDSPAVNANRNSQKETP